jgi:hypothetical protein
LYTDQQYPTVYDDAPVLQLQTLDDCTPNQIHRLYGELPSNSRHYFDTNNFIYFRICEPGKLRLFVQGTHEDGAGSFFLVSLDDAMVWEGEVVDEQLLELDIGDSGWLTLAFLNSPNELGTNRRLWLWDISFESQL